LLLAVGFVLSAPAALAQGGLAGTWTYSEEAEGQTVETRLTFAQAADGTWTGEGDFLGPMPMHFVMQNVSFIGEVIRFDFPIEGFPVTGKFFGRYSEENDTVSGHVTIPGLVEGQEDAVFTRFDEAAAAAAEIVPLRVRHPQTLAVAARFQYLVPLHIVRLDVENINDVTTSGLGVDVSGRIYILDGFAIEGRYFTGSLKFREDLPVFSDDLAPALSGDSRLGMSGWNAGIKAYVGPSLFPDSRYNPYLAAAVGQTLWSLTASGGGSTVLSILGEPLDATSWHASAGLGTEYELSERIRLEFEWSWNYHMLEDESVWPRPEELWTNQHTWNLSFGLVLGI